MESGKAHANAINQIFNFLQAGARTRSPKSQRERQCALRCSNEIYVEMHLQFPYLDDLREKHRFFRNVRVPSAKTSTDKSQCQCFWANKLFANLALTHRYWLGRYCNSTELKYTSQSKKLILLDKLLCFAQRIFKEKGKNFFMGFELYE